MKLYIPAAYGIEAAVKREIERLGFGHAPAVRGRVELEGDWETVARLNVFLRAGERVLLGVGEFPATTFDELFEGARALPWEEYLSRDSKILIDGKSVKSTLAAVKAAGGVVKKAILGRLKEKLGATAFPETGPRAVVGVSIFEDIVTLTLDTSGDGLHKRGYRVLTYDAPLRETTAAAIIEDSFYNREKPFADLFCGSGTLAVEAALYARNIAPGMERKFDFAAWKCTPHGALERARQEARDGVYTGPVAPIFAGDISPRAIQIAEEHARRAGVKNDIAFSVRDMREFASELGYGVLISNPPYGERMEKGADLFPLYRDFAKVYRSLPAWSAYLISGYEVERAFGRAQKKRILYNANIRCGLYCYFGQKPPKNP